MNSELPPLGALVVDTRTERMGRVMDRLGPYLQLRPPDGGEEWECPPEAIRAAGITDQLPA